MDLQNVLAVVGKDFYSIRRKKSVVYGIIVLPLLLSVVFTSVVQNQVGQIIQNGGVVPTTLTLGFESLVYFFVVLAAILPGSIAAYSIVGEKVEKSLEPLLATPMSDGEILLGKCIASFVPPILATWAGAAIFMALSDYILYSALSLYYFPDIISDIMILLLAPLVGIYSVELTVIVSSRVSDVRGATQIASLMFIPFMAVFVEAVSGSFDFSLYNLLVFSGVMLAVDVALFFASTTVFRREEILTKWR